MARIFAIAFAAAALTTAGMSVAEANSIHDYRAGFFTQARATPVAYHYHVAPSYADDEDDDDDYADDDDDDDTESQVVVEDIEDCAPGKFRMVEFGDLEVPVACH